MDNEEEEEVEAGEGQVCFADIEAGLFSAGKPLNPKPCGVGCLTAESCAARIEQ